MKKNRFSIHRIARSVLIILIAIAVAMPAATSTAEAKGKASVKKMRVYDNVLKSGNYAYCAVSDDGVYKVNLKTKKVTRLTKVTEVVLSMKKKGRYLYYIESTMGGSWLYRVNVKTGKRQRLGRCYDYVISGTKIYNGGWVMNLDGSSKKRAKVSVKMKSVKSSDKNYRLIEKYTEAENGQNFKVWLKTPGGKIFICNGFFMYG